MSNPFSFQDLSPTRQDPEAVASSDNTLDMCEYAQTRPAYPPEAVAAIADLLDSTSDTTVNTTPNPAPALILDIGAGSGIFTRQLATELSKRTQPFSIRAIEPSAEMRQTWTTGNASQIDLVEASAEETGCDSSSVSLVTFAQSFHWVDPHRTALELSRILRPGGKIGMLWNQMDVQIPWVHRLSRIMRSGDVHRPDKPPVLPGFTAAPPLTFAFEQRLRVPDVMKLARTRSSYFRSTPQVRQRMQANLRWYLLDHLDYAPDATVCLPYHTYVWELTRAPGYNESTESK